MVHMKEQLGMYIRIFLIIYNVKIKYAYILGLDSLSSLEYDSLREF